MADSTPGHVQSALPREQEALLLLARPGDQGAAAYCGDHMAVGQDPDAVPLIVLTDGPAAGAASSAGAGVVVVVGDSTRSAAGGDGAPAPGAQPNSPPETVLATGDLGSVGGTVDDYLATWSAAGHRPVVCVDSISGLLDGASIPATYRFLYVLLRRVDALGAAAHAHADPRDHEEEILRTFFSLFDRIVSFRDGGASHR